MKQKHLDSEHINKILKYQSPPCQIYGQSHKNSPLEDICIKNSGKFFFEPVCSQCLIFVQKEPYEIKSLKSILSQLLKELEEAENPLIQNTKNEILIIKYRDIARQFRDLGDSCYQISNNMFQVFDSFSYGKQNNNAKELQKIYDDIIKYQNEKNLRQCIKELKQYVKIKDDHLVFERENQESQIQKQNLEHHIKEYLEVMQFTLNSLHKNIQNVKELSLDPQQIIKQYKEVKQMQNNTNINSTNNNQSFSIFEQQQSMFQQPGHQDNKHSFSESETKRPYEKQIINQQKQIQEQDIPQLRKSLQQFNNNNSNNNFDSKLSQNPQQINYQSHIPVLIQQQQQQQQQQLQQLQQSFSKTQDQIQLSQSQYQNETNLDNSLSHVKSFTYQPQQNQQQQFQPQFQQNQNNLVNNNSAIQPTNQQKLNSEMTFNQKNNQQNQNQTNDFKKKPQKIFAENSSSSPQQLHSQQTNNLLNIIEEQQQQEHKHQQHHRQISEAITFQQQQNQAEVTQSFYLNKSPNIFQQDTTIKHLDFTSNFKKQQQQQQEVKENQSSNNKKFGRKEIMKKIENHIKICQHIECKIIKSGMIGLISKQNQFIETSCYQGLELNNELRDFIQEQLLE